MITADQIRAAKPEGKMTLVSGSFLILFDNGVAIQCDSSQERKTVWNKLLRMGYERHYNFQSDEMEGLSKANPKSDLSNLIFYIELLTQYDNDKE